MFDSISLHQRDVARAVKAMAAHSPSVSSTREGGCVCYKCENARKHLSVHKSHASDLTDNENGIYCRFCSDWVVFYLTEVPA